MGIVKKHLSKRNILIIIFGVLFVAVIVKIALSFNKSTPAQSESEIVSEKKWLLSSFETTGSGVVSLYKDSSHKFIFMLEGGETIMFSTNDFVESFRMMGDSKILYVANNADTSVNSNPKKVVLVDITTETKDVLYYGEEVFIEADDKMYYIFDNKNNYIASGSNRSDVKKISNSTVPISKIFKDKNRVFVLSYTNMLGDEESVLYEVINNTLHEVHSSFGKILSVNIDYYNSNKLYIYKSFQSKDKKNVSYSTGAYFIETSLTSNSNEEIYSELNGDIISLKNKTLYMDRASGDIYTLNSNMSLSSKVAKCNENMLWSFLKESASNEKLYFLDENNGITYI